MFKKGWVSLACVLLCAFFDAKVMLQTSSPTTRRNLRSLLKQVPNLKGFLPEDFSAGKNVLDKIANSRKNDDGSQQDEFEDDRGHDVDQSIRRSVIMMDDDEEVQGIDPAEEPTTLFAWGNEGIRGNRRKAKKKEDLVNPLEAHFLIKYDLESLDVGFEKSRKLVASDEMIQRITEIQAMLVRTRTRLLESLLKRAYIMTTDIEYEFPQKHSCSVELCNELILRSWPSMYPYGLLNMVKGVKEALLKSKVDDIPIAVVDEHVYRRLEFVLNNLGSRLRGHGKLVYRLFVDLVIAGKRILRQLCDIPRRASPVDLKFED